MISGTELTVMPTNPHRPKRPKSGFYLFAADHSAEVKASGKGRGWYWKRLGQMWKNVDAETKENYQVKFL